MRRTLTVLLVVGGAAALIALGVGVFYLYSLTRDLPSVDALKNYNPPVTTRVYAGDGTILGEYARQRRIFVPIEFVPKLVIEAFTSAEDRNFFNHPGIDPSGIAARRSEGCFQRPSAQAPRRRLDHHPAGGEELPAQHRSEILPQDARGHPRHPHRRDLFQVQDPRTLSERNLSRPKFLWCRRCRR